MKKLLLKNSISGALQQLLVMLLLFFTIPLFIKLLGPEKYGIFSLLMVIGNLNSFVTLGLNSSLVKYLAEQGKCNESDLDLILVVLFQILLIFPIIALLILFKQYVIISILHVPVVYYESTKNLFFWMVLSSGIVIIGQTISSVIDSFQKVYINNIFQFVYSVLYWGLIIAILLLGYSLNEIGMASFFASLIWFLLVLFYSLKLWGKFETNGMMRNCKRILMKHIAYGAKLYASGMIGFFYEPFTKVLISHFIGVAEVGFFDIAIRMRTQIMNVIFKLFVPLFPFLAQQKDESIIRKYIHDLEQKSFLVLMPIVVVVVFLLNIFIEFWLHKNVTIISVTTIYIVSAHLLFSCTVSPLYIFLMAKDKAGKTIIIQTSNVFFNTIAFFVFVRYWGYYTVIVSNIIGIFSSFVISLYFQKKYLNSLIFDSFVQLRNYLFASLIIFGFGYVYSSLFNKSSVIMLLLPVFVGLLSLELYKFYSLLTFEDIKRYFDVDFVLKIRSKFGI